MTSSGSSEVLAFASESRIKGNLLKFKNLTFYICNVSSNQSNIRWLAIDKVAGWQWSSAPSSVVNSLDAQLINILNNKNKSYKIKICMKE